MRIIGLLLLIFVVLKTASAQKPTLNYYLPDIKYNPDIPTPEEFLGYQIGEWHISHDQQYSYMKKLAELSPRIAIKEHGRSYEHRPLVHLIVTSPTNHNRLDELKTQHRKLSDPSQSTNINIENMPAVIYQGFSIHGNEPSGANAAPLVAYYLAAAQGPEIERMLEEMIILLDPSFNPDGLTRFSTWVNMHKNANLTSDPDDREYNEIWPRGRTNHYWFDLNRDWLPVQHPESQGRIQVFHDWKPNVLTDHHEMGSNSTFFFMPGEPTRVHPLTPQKNQVLTAKIAEFHAAALDKIGALYYSGEGYDDFYYGKGSTYPDINACIGILFEQASSRGHLQETDNGLLSFPFTIRNQVTTALSTQKAALSLRKELLSFQLEFYQSAMEEARQDGRVAFVFGDAFDNSRNQHLVEILRRHQINVHKLGRQVNAEGMNFQPEHAYVVPLEQPQYRLIKAMFDPLTTFEDSLFYDVSSWTLPLAFNLPHIPVYKRNAFPDMLGEVITGLKEERSNELPRKSNYAYLINWDDYYAPKAVYQLQRHGLRAKVATEPLIVDGRQYHRGTVMIPVENQKKSSEEIAQLVSEAAQQSGVAITGVQSGYVKEGPDLGSNYFQPLEMPKVLLVIGNGVSSSDAGEVWHLFDQRYNMVTTMVETERLSRLDLWKYNNIVLVNGNYNSISNGTVTTLRRWIQDGGTLITAMDASAWATQKGLANVSIRKKDADQDDDRRPYTNLRRDAGAKVIGGAIFEMDVDLTHPLFFGYHRERVPLFQRGTLFFNPTKNPYATPAVYTKEPLLSGYLNEVYTPLIAESAAVVVSGIGQGKVISMSHNPNFRAFWFGTNQLFINSIFFGKIISGTSTESTPPPKEEKE